MTVKNTALKKTIPEEQLRDLVVAGMQDKRAQSVVSINLKNIEEAVCDYFVVCHANSTTQVKAIAESIMKKVEEDSTDEKPWRKEGFKNLEWVLIDYVDVVAHIFLKDRREFYSLEDLWADGIAEEFEDVV